MGTVIATAWQAERKHQPGLEASMLVTAFRAPGEPNIVRFRRAARRGQITGLTTLRHHEHYAVPRSGSACRRAHGSRSPTTPSSGAQHGVHAGAERQQPQRLSSGDHPLMLIRCALAVLYGVCRLCFCTASRLQTMPFCSCVHCSSCIQHGIALLQVDVSLWLRMGNVRCLWHPFVLEHCSRTSEVQLQRHACLPFLCFCAG
jgi:hypothetical protein